MNKIILIGLFSITFNICSSQSLDSPLIENLKKDVIYLSSDELEGRNTGTESEKIAADYIIERLNFYQVKPKGTKGFFQEFTAKINAIAKILGSTLIFSAISTAIGVNNTAHALFEIKLVVIETSI